MWAERGGLQWVSFYEPVTLRTPLGSLPLNCAKCALVQLYYCRGAYRVRCPQPSISSYIFLITYHQKLEDVERLTMAGMVEGFVYFNRVGAGGDTVTAVHGWIVERQWLFM